MHSESIIKIGTISSGVYGVWGCVVCNGDLVEIIAIVCDVSIVNCLWCMA
jgi:hypothetical protein